MDIRTNIFRFNAYFWAFIIPFFIILYNQKVEQVGLALGFTKTLYERHFIELFGEKGKILIPFYIFMIIVSLVGLLVNRAVGVARTDGKDWKWEDLQKDHKEMGLHFSIVNGKQAILVSLLIILISALLINSEYPDLVKSWEFIRTIQIN